MTDKQLERRNELIRRHTEKMSHTTVEQRRRSADRVINFFSQFRDVDIDKMKEEAIINR